MDTVVIVLLVLGVIAIILAAKGKPLWNNWAKPLWLFLKQFNAQYPDVKIWVLIAVIIWITMWFVRGLE